MHEERRHAAILFTDIAGYTRLMGSDELRAFDLLKRNREIHLRLISAYGGALIKEIGDGMLVAFSLATDAVRCAIDIQKSCREEDIPLKAGIHEGEMLFAGEDVLGDGVNISSRLQESADPGQILISGSVYIDVRNQPDIRPVLVGERHFKNVDEKIRVYSIGGPEQRAVLKSFRLLRLPRWSVRLALITGAVLLLSAVAVVLVRMDWRAERFLQRDKSIAVLPFHNMSGEAENQYFCDGMMEDILTHLTYIGGLQVTSRTSSMQYRESAIGIPLIARQLGVNYVLEGSVRRDSDRVLVTVQLINARNDMHLWSGRYTERLTMDNLWEIQNRIAEDVASSLEISISPGLVRNAMRKPTGSYPAYDLYLKGREYYKRYYPADNDIAIRLYRRAIDLDPGYALAYCGMADAYAQRVIRFGYGREMLDSAEYHAKMGLLHNERLPEAYKTLGLVERTKNNLDMAVSYVHKAVELNPNFVEAIGSLGFFLVCKGQYEEGADYLQRALKLSPRDTEILNFLGVMHFYLGDFERGKFYFGSSLVIEPDNRFALYSYAMCLAAQRDWPAYAAFSEEAHRYTKENKTRHWQQGLMHYNLGDFQEAIVHFEASRDTLYVAACYLEMNASDTAVSILRSALDTSLRSWDQRPGLWTDFKMASDLALCHLMLGNSGEACRWLRIALQEGHAYMYRLFLQDPVITSRDLPECIIEVLSEYESHFDLRGLNLSED